MLGCIDVTATWVWFKPQQNNWQTSCFKIIIENYLASNQCRKFKVLKGIYSQKRFFFATGSWYWDKLGEKFLGLKTLRQSQQKSSTTFLHTFCICVAYSLSLTFVLNSLTFFTHFSKPVYKWMQICLGE